MIYLDTHILIWLFEKKLKKFQKSTILLIENNDLYISPIVELEIQFLYEIGRIKQQSKEIISAMKKELFLKSCELPFEAVIGEAMKVFWTRDPFDRIIVSQAKAGNRPLITKDEMILKNYENAIW